MKRKTKVLLCAVYIAVLLAMLTGCSCAPASSAASPASTTAVSSSVPAASSAASASSEVQKVSLPQALDACIGWGGDAGSSLKSMIAACSLLDWAEDNNAAQMDSAELCAKVDEWVNGLTEEQRSMLDENWSDVASNADMLLSDPASMADLLDSAGNPNQHSSYTAANWEALKAALDAAQAA